MPVRRCGPFRATLFRYPGKGGLTLARIPKKHAPPVTHAWGRTPVEATVDGCTWATSVWHASSGRTVLAVPKRARGTKVEGDTVRVELAFDSSLAD